MSRHMRAPIMLTIAAAAGAAALVSTGFAGGAGGAEPHRTAPAQVRSVDAVGTVAFTKRALRTTPGRVTLVSRNRTPLRHNIAIRGKRLPTPVKGRVVQTGGVSRVSATLRPGVYVFYCSVGGHAAAGMRGTLTVAR